MVSPRLRVDWSESTVLAPAPETTSHLRPLQSLGHRLRKGPFGAGGPTAVDGTRDGWEALRSSSTRWTYKSPRTRQQAEVVPEPGEARGELIEADRRATVQ